MPSVLLLCRPTCTAPRPIPCPQVAYFWWGAVSTGVMVAVPLVRCLLGCCCRCFAAYRHGTCCLCCDGCCCCDGGGAHRVVPISEDSEAPEASFAWARESHLQELAPGLHRQPFTVPPPAQLIAAVHERQAAARAVGISRVEALLP